MNKKGQPPAIALFVFMVVVLVGAALFSFYRGSEKAKVDLARPGFAESVYALEADATSDINSAGERAIIKSYNEVISDNPFEKSQEDLDGIMKSKVSNYFSSDEIIASKYKNIKFEIGVNDEEIEINSSQFRFETSAVSKDGASINVVYKTNVSEKFNLTDYGLYGFGFIKENSDICLAGKEADVIKKCLSERLPYLVSDVKQDEKGIILVSFKTEEKYLLEGDFKDMEFSLA